MVAFFSPAGGRNAVRVSTARRGSYVNIGSACHVNHLYLRSACHVNPCEGDRVLCKHTKCSYSHSNGTDFGAKRFAIQVSHHHVDAGQHHCKRYASADGTTHECHCYCWGAAAEAGLTEEIEDATWGMSAMSALRGGTD